MTCQGGCGQVIATQKIGIETGLKVRNYHDIGCLAQHMGSKMVLPSREDSLRSGEKISTCYCEPQGGRIHLYFFSEVNPSQG